MNAFIYIFGSMVSVIVMTMVSIDHSVSSGIAVGFIIFTLAGIRYNTGRDE